MKIDEPKTPFAPRYDPAQDEEEMRRAEAEDALLNAKGLVVDELDKTKKKEDSPPTTRGVSEDQIPAFELGEPEEALPASTSKEEGGRIVRERSHSGSEKRVSVGGSDHGDGGKSGDDVEDKRMTPAEYEDKHRDFEEKRKKHYEMKDVKNLLAYACSSPTYACPLSETVGLIVLSSLLVTPNGWRRRRRRRRRKMMMMMKATLNRSSLLPFPRFRSGSLTARNSAMLSSYCSSSGLELMI